MDTKLGAAARGGGSAFLQVGIYVLGSTVAIAIAVMVLFRWDLIQSFIFASMIGGETAAAVVIPLSRSLRLSDVTVAFLTFESAVNSIFSIVLFFAFVGFYQSGTGSWIVALSSLAANFSVGIVLGTMFSVVWILALHRLQQQKYTYVLTLGLVLVTYVASARLAGSGELSVLIFGIVLGNYSIFNRLTNWHLSMDVLQERLSVFQEEISFLMAILFFVFLGLTFQINTSLVIANLTVSVIVLCFLLFFRTSATYVSTKNSELSEDRGPIVLMCAQGSRARNLGHHSR